jgi:hypothetical protein
MSITATSSISGSAPLRPFVCRPHLKRGPLDGPDLILGMDYRQALEKLQDLRALVEKVNADRYSSSEEIRAIARQIPERYGEVEDVYQRFAGQRNVVVQDGKQTNTFSNYFESGYLSGRTFHVHEGYQELLKVIGRVKQAVADPTLPRDERSLATVIEILQRFRQCCQYLQEPPTDERAVQAIMWIMLRSRFDRLDREDMLPRFGVKRYAPDFGIPELRLLIEVKFVGPTSKPAAIQEEILADVPGYLQANSQFDAILVFIYDAAHKLRDTRKLIEDLRSVTGIVDVIVTPGIGAA